MMIVHLRKKVKPLMRKIFKIIIYIIVLPS
jgi:hypothetical protein